MKREASKVRTPPITDCVYTVREGPIVMQTAVSQNICLHPQGPVEMTRVGLRHDLNLEGVNAGE